MTTKRTFTRNAHNGIGIRFHSQQLDDLFNVVEFFLAAHAGGLSKDRTESQRLPDGRGREMKILLLNITGFALERPISRTAVNQHLT